MLETFLHKIHEGFDTSTAVEPTAWREALRIINEGTVEGLMQSKVTTHSQQLLSSLKHSNEVFAAFKVHQMGELMAAKLDDGKGGIKDFAQWKKEVASIASHHVGHWLRTEYDTAVIRAHNAADWAEFERDKDIMPNLRWMPTTSPNPDGAHQVFWEQQLTLPIDHPFWKKHYPGNRWNCKCMLEQTDDPISEKLPDNIDHTDKPQRGLDTPPREGETFSQSHPYFPASCYKCPFAPKGIRNAFVRVFRNEGKSCMNCKYINIETLRLKLSADYPTEDWIHEVINPNGGYVVIHKDRFAKGLRSANEKEVYKKELAACKLAASQGHRIVYLNDGHAGGTYDILLDGIATDLKKTKSHNNIVKYAKKASQKQDADAIFYCFEEENNLIYEKLYEVKRKYKSLRVFYYFEKQGVMKEHKKG